jgi:uncharacterized protein (TIGR02246 family)
MSLRNSWPWGVWLLLLAATSTVSAQTPRSTSANDEAAIRAAGKSYVDALNRGDVKALLAAWTPDGDYIDQYGRRHIAHELIQQEFATPAGEERNQRQRVVEQETSIRFLTPDVAIEDGVTRVEAPGVVAASASTFTAIWVKRQERWLLASIRECAPSIEAASPLERLTWMLGHWSGEADGMRYEWTGYWDDQGPFLLRDFKVYRGEELVMRGTQRLGWDAAQKLIRSWAFDSQGGFGEGIWGNDENSWYVENHGSLADGRSMESLNVYTINEDGSVTWRVENCKVDGQAMPDSTVKYIKK